MLAVVALAMASCGGKKETKTTATEPQKVQEAETVILQEPESGEEFFTEEGLDSEIPDFEEELDLDDFDIDLSDSGSANWDKVLDEYEKFVNSYISWANKANKGDASALAESVEMMEKAEKFSLQKESAEGDMSTAQMNRLLKLENKMADAALKAADNMENMMDDLEDLDDEDFEE